MIPNLPGFTLLERLELSINLLELDKRTVEDDEQDIERMAKLCEANVDTSMNSFAAWWKELPLSKMKKIIHDMHFTRWRLPDENGQRVITAGEPLAPPPDPQPETPPPAPAGPVYDMGDGGFDGYD